MITEAAVVVLVLVIAVVACVVFCLASWIVRREDDDL